MYAAVDSSDQSVCDTCLSSGRRVAPLGTGLRSSYVALTDFDAHADPTICWECAALLRRAKQFRLRAARSQARLRAGGGHLSQDFKSESSLWTTIPVLETIQGFETTEEQYSSPHQSFSREVDDLKNFLFLEATHEPSNVEIVDKLSDSDFTSDKDDLFPKHASKKHGTKTKKRIKKASKRKESIFVKTKPDVKLDGLNSSTLRHNHEMTVTDDALSNIENNVVVDSDIYSQKPKKPKGIRKAKNTDGSTNKRGRPRTMMTVLTMNGDEVLKYRKEELERESFRSAKYKCETCLLVLCKSNYTQHMQQAHGKETSLWLCKICGIRCSTKSKLDKHLQQHYQLYCCNKCDFKCLSQGRMRYHFERLHKLNKYHQCSTCTLKFAQWFELRAHLKTEHKMKDNYYECDKCGMRVNCQRRMEKHLKTHELKVCSVCNFTAKTNNNLSIHYQRKHDVAPVLSEVYCVECNKQYFTSLAYKTHLSMVHTPKPEPKVPCTDCNKIFRNERNLKNHYAIMHLKETKYHCDKCNKYFYGKASLQLHTERVHNGLLYPKNKMCTICGRGFSTKRILLHHVRTHTGERPHKCEFCNAAFAQKTAMKNHEKNVHLRINKS